MSRDIDNIKICTLIYSECRFFSYSLGNLAELFSRSLGSLGKRNFANGGLRFFQKIESVATFAMLALEVHEKSKHKNF